MRLFTTAILAFCASSLWASSTYDAIAPYVFPQNKPETPAESVFMPDESATVELTADGKRIVTRDIRSGELLETLFDVANTRSLTLDDIEGFVLSPDASKILVYRERTPIYRRSWKARWWYYDRHSRILAPLVSDDGFAREALWSPDSRMVAFVADDNNIRIRKTDYGTEVAVTRDGCPNAVINGAADWTYEEEFYTTCSMAWAPDNLTLSFLKYNEKDVPMYHFALYDGVCHPNPDYAQYPGTFEYKYPMAGVQNSVVTLHSYDVETRRLKDIDLNALSPGRIEYIARIDYAGAPDRLVATTLNRYQNRLELFAVNPRSAVARSLYVEEKSSGWIETQVYDDLRFYDDFFVIASDRSGWTHLYCYGYSGALQRQLTQGDYDITAYYGYDKRQGIHYYQSCETGAINRVVTRLDAKGRATRLTEAEGTGAAVFSPAMSYATLSYSSVNIAPRYTLVTPANGRAVRLLADNNDLARRFVDAPKPEFITIPAEGAAPSLNAYVIKPSPFDPAKRYPVIMYQYSGPGSQEVRNRWVIDWANYYATRGFVVFCVDGRGTGCRGRQFREAVYRHLGTLETEDQLRGARYVASLPYVDPARIGMFGWSFGGYEAIMSATAPANPFKATVAVAPVTDWRLYDSVYTERYMSTPQQNEEGYDTSSTFGRVSNLSGRLLIMHGTADDNVHLANTMEFVSRLIGDGRYCDIFLFPNMNHSINYCDGRRLLYTRMFDYFNQNL